MTTDAMHGATHVVTNQVPPLADLNLFETNAALRDAVRFNDPALAPDSLAMLGAMAGSAHMHEHARLANIHGPVLRSHDRFGNRIGAQAHLQGFYGRHGYVAVGETYLEDDIVHIDMERPAS